MSKKVIEKIKHLFSNIYVQYTFLFIIFYICVFSPFLVYGKAYLWSSDGMSQHYPSLLYTKEWVYSILESIKEGDIYIPFWSTYLGFGQDVFGNAINFRLFNFLYVFFGSFSVDTYLSFRTIGSLFLCGIAFLYFAKSKNKNRISLLFGTMIYLFSGFSLYFATRHPFFLEMMFYFPLMLYGIDVTFKKKKSYMFIAMVFFSAISYFYFLYMITLPAIVYALFRYFEIRKKKERNIKDFFLIVLRFFWQYLLGLLLAAFSLLPSIIRSFSSSRTSVETGINYLHWDLSYYEDFLTGIIDMQQIGIYGFIALSGIAFFAIMYMIFDHSKKKRLYLGQFVIYTITFLIPFLVLAFSGFAGRTQRWCYVYIFWVAMIVVEMLPKMLEKNETVFAKSCMCTAGYLAVYLFISYRTDGKISSGIIWLFLYALILVVINLTGILQNKKRVVCLLMMGMLCFEITMKSYELYSPQGENYISDFANAGKVAAAGTDNSSTALDMTSDDSLYRVDVVSSPMSKKYNQMNYGLRNYTNGISSYYSFSDERICQYSLDMGNSQQNIKFLILDWDQRTLLNELSSVKYLTTTDSCNNRIPYGYELIGSDKKWYSDGESEMEYLYENKYALPMMYVYDSYIPEKEYEKLETNEKEQAMLQGVVIEEDIDYPETKLSFDYNVLLDKESILEQMRNLFAEDDSVEVYDDHILVKNDSTKVTLSIPEGIEGELYWMMDKVKFHSVNTLEPQVEELKDYLIRYDWQNLKKDAQNWEADDVTSVNVRMGDQNDTCTLLNNTYQYYFGERNSLLNIGYTTTEDSITVTFGRAGEYSFDDLKLVSQPMDKYEERVNQLKKNPVENIAIEKNSIKGSVTTGEKKLVCISLPYSEGWKAYINGKETKIYPANGMNMAVMVEAGDNNIYLEYTTPGFYIGCAISLGVAGILIIVVIAVKVTKGIRYRR